MKLQWAARITRTLFWHDSVLSSFHRESHIHSAIMQGAPLQLGKGSCILLMQKSTVKVSSSVCFLRIDWFSFELFSVSCWCKRSEQLRLFPLNVKQLFVDMILLLLLAHHPPLPSRLLWSFKQFSQSHTNILQICNLFQVPCLTAEWCCEQFLLNSSNIPWAPVHIWLWWW